MGVAVAEGTLEQLCLEGKGPVGHVSLTGVEAGEYLDAFLVLPTHGDRARFEAMLVFDEDRRLTLLELYNGCDGYQGDIVCGKFIDRDRETWLEAYNKQNAAVLGRKFKPYPTGIEENA